MYMDILLFGCTSKNIDYQSTDINFGKFKYFQSMYSGEKHTKVLLQALLL